MDQVADCASLFPELTVERALIKAVEEIGEAADALIGVEGWNPRKGVYSSHSELGSELLDVALTALIAWTKLAPPEDEDPDGFRESQMPLVALIHHAAERAARHRRALGIPQLLRDAGFLPTDRELFEAENPKGTANDQFGPRDWEGTD